jgi:hypothetical protein
LKGRLFPVNCFVGTASTKQLAQPTKPFCHLFAELAKRSMVNQAPSPGGDHKPPAVAGDGQMRTLKYLLACAFVLAGSPMAGIVDGGLPGVGTFAYSGPSIVSPALLVAANEK